MQPDDPRAHGTREWLGKAADDLGAARLLQAQFAAESAFHCQQAVEKALKGFLFWYNRPFRKTHNLEELGEACSHIDSSLQSVVDRAAPLAEYAWKFRYPGPLKRLSDTDIEEALSAARDVVEAVRDRLPVEAQP